MMLVAPLLFFGLITSLLARRKGYNPLCWFFAGSVVGLLVLAFRPFTNDGGLNDEERTMLQRKGNQIGLVVSGLALALALFLKIALSL